MEVPRIAEWRRVSGLLDFDFTNARFARPDVAHCQKAMVNGRRQASDRGRIVQPGPNTVDLSPLQFTPTANLGLLNARNSSCLALPYTRV